MKDAYAPDGEIELLYSEAICSPDGTGLTLFDVYAWPEDLLIGPYGHVLQASFYVYNVRTAQLEKNVIFADIPSMPAVTTQTSAE